MSSKIDILNFQSTIKKQKTISLISVLIIYYFACALIYSLYDDKTISLLLSLILYVIPIFFLKKIYTEQINKYYKWESIIFLSKEILKSNDYELSTLTAIEAFYENTFKKYNKNYHTEEISSRVGRFILAKKDLYLIVRNTNNKQIELASNNYNYFDTKFIHSLIEDDKKHIEYQDRTFQLQQAENNKWDRILSGTGVTSEEIFEETNKKIKEKEEFERLHSASNENNRRSLVATGLCPFCKSSIRRDSTKCPNCTADIIVKHHTSISSEDKKTSLRATGMCPHCKSNIRRDATKCPNCTGDI